MSPRSSLQPSSEADIATALRTHYFSAFPSGYLDTSEGQHDLTHELRGRLANTRQQIIPWLLDAAPLRGTRVLEIGCGTGSASVAIAEQGAHVTGIDVLPGALEVAQVRVQAQGLADQCVFAHVNATEASERLRGQRFDWIIFYASLEHMTTTEKIDAIRSTWAMLPPGGRWVVVEAPNRLWYFDAHSSLLPFFHWLPDDLAIRYTQRSSRASMREQFGGAPGRHTPEALARYGRCLSFHEFDLALGDARSLPVVSSFNEFEERRFRALRVRRTLARVKKWASYRMLHQDYLATLCDGLHAGWFDEYLQVIFRKPAADG
jgi:2-polyprenyl-3-methyl-5-hydroxy-6-metoxy-1,4-benzoquinol methylase